MNPILIIDAMDRTGEELRYLSHCRSLTIDECKAHSLLGEEYAERSVRETAIRLDEALESLAQMNELVEAAEQAEQSASQQFNESQVNLGASKLQLDKSNSALSFWSDQVVKATNWVNRATRRLQEAKLDLQAARDNHYHCQRELSQRESDLAWARTQTTSVAVGTDQKGGTIYQQVPIDTSPYELAVAEAEADLREARQWLARAEEEFRLAEIDLGKAKAQLSGAQQARDDCQNAVKLAQNSLAEANEALQYAEQSLDDAKRAVRESERAKQETEEEIGYCEQAVTEAQHSEKCIEEGRLQLITAEEITDSSNQRGYMANLSMESKTEHLKAFDRPLF